MSQHLELVISGSLQGAIWYLKLLLKEECQLVKSITLISGEQLFCFRYFNYFFEMLRFDTGLRLEEIPLCFLCGLHWSYTSLKVEGLSPIPHVLEPTLVCGQKGINAVLPSKVLRRPHVIKTTENNISFWRKMCKTRQRTVILSHMADCGAVLVYIFPKYCSF